MKNITILKQKSDRYGEGHIVLCYWRSRNEYVTWWQDKKGNKFYGHYFLSYLGADMDYISRSL